MSHQQQELSIDKDPIYADIKPIPQDDGPEPVVLIRYPKDFKLIHGYFRAILLKNEKSDRAFNITTKVIKKNPANYTAWQYRRELIFKLNKNLYDELEFTKEMALMQPKNYQLWWHRRVIIKKVCDNDDQKNDDNNDNNNNNKPNMDTSRSYDIKQEIELLRGILNDDGKNYHVWSHYHWVLREYKLYSGELKYIQDVLLKKDVRNNSAWNHRHFVMTQTNGYKKLNDIVDDMTYCKKQILRVPSNHSVWYYYTSLITKYLKDVTSVDVSNNDETKQESNNENSFETYRLQEIKWIQDVITKKPYATRGYLYYVDLLTHNGNNKNELNKAIELLELLGDKVDRIRINYYKYLIQDIKQKIQNL